MNYTESVDFALNVLRGGGVILYPTDTIWGLGCDATCSDAVNKIIRLKGRSDNQSFIVLVHEVKLIEHYIEQVPEIAYSLIEVSDTPLTIIYPGAHPSGLAPQVIAPDGSVAIRVVQHPFCSSILQKFRKPIVSTSANLPANRLPPAFPPSTSTCTSWLTTAWTQPLKRPPQENHLPSSSSNSTAK